SSPWRVEAVAIGSSTKFIAGEGACFRPAALTAAEFTSGFVSGTFALLRALPPPAFASGCVEGAEGFVCAAASDTAPAAKSAAITWGTRDFMGASWHRTPSTPRGSDGSPGQSERRIGIRLEFPGSPMGDGDGQGLLDCFLPRGPRSGEARGLREARRAGHPGGRRQVPRPRHGGARVRARRHAADGAGRISERGPRGRLPRRSGIPGGAARAGRRIGRPRPADRGRRRVTIRSRRVSQGCRGAFRYAYPHCIPAATCPVAAFIRLKK